ncbi:hypothetical protein PoHVEF18_010646 [Penicillium ochrochloron]
MKGDGDTYLSSMGTASYVLPSIGWPVQGYTQSAIGPGELSLNSTIDLDNKLGGKIWLAIGAYSSNCEIVQFTNAVGVTLFFSATTRQHVVGEAISVLLDTWVTPQLFGWSSGDATTAIQNAINATARVMFPPGTYPVTGLTTGDTQTFHLKGAAATRRSSSQPRTVISVFGGEIPDILRIGDLQVAAAEEESVIEDILFNGMSLATNGVHFNRAQNCVVRNAEAQNCVNGFFVDGTAAIARARLMQILFENCYTTGNNYGYNVLLSAFASGAFSGFTFFNCSSESDANGFNITTFNRDIPGVISTIVKIDSCEVQGTAAIGIKADGCTLSIADTYLEVAGINLFATNNARIFSTNSRIYHPIVDITSTITAEQSVVNEVGAVRTRMNIGQISDGPGWSSAGWGPPNYPSRQPGAIYPKGFSFTDALGVEWICTAPGTSGLATFTPRHGKILVPLDFTQITNYNVIWWPFEDFVISNISIACKTTFVAGTATFLRFGTLANNSAQDDIIQVSASGDNSLTAKPASNTSTVLSASRNTAVNAILNGRNKYFMAGCNPNQGPAHPTSPGNGTSMRCFTDGTWTAGTALIIIEGTSFKYE